MGKTTPSELRTISFTSLGPLVAVLSVIALVGLAAPAAAETEAAPKAETKTETPAKPSGDAVAQVDAFIAKQAVDKTNARWRTSLTKPPLADFSAGKTYMWVLETSQGTMKVKLLGDSAPMHATSTIYLTKLGFYDGLSFHRVIPGFMAQGGCPLGTGTGNPGYKYAGEFGGTAKHDTQGILSMANAGPGTDGSQFFLTFGPTPHLNGKHTVFGRVVDGHAALKAIEALGSPRGRPTEKVTINKATIVVN